jgi:hypothetical protein
VRLYLAWWSDSLCACVSVGIFRVSGPVDEFMMLKGMFDRGEPVDLMELVRFRPGGGAVASEGVRESARVGELQ